NPVISPDGKLLAYTFYDETVKKWRTAVSRFDGGQPLKVFDFASERNLLRWTQDGSALAFIKGFTGGQEIWLQTLDGSSQKQLADFRSSDDVFDFAWSPDHKKLACVRGADLFDAVLFTNFR